MYLNPDTGQTRKPGFLIERLGMKPGCIDDERVVGMDVQINGFRFPLEDPTESRR